MPRQRKFTFNHPQLPTELVQPIEITIPAYVKGIAVVELTMNDLATIGQLLKSLEPEYEVLSKQTQHHTTLLKSTYDQLIKRAGHNYGVLLNSARVIKAQAIEIEELKQKLESAE